MKAFPAMRNLGGVCWATRKCQRRLPFTWIMGQPVKSTQAAMPGALQIWGMWSARGKPWSRSMTGSTCLNPDTTGRASLRHGWAPLTTPRGITGITPFPSRHRMTGLPWQRKSWDGGNWKNIRWPISAALSGNWNPACHFPGMSGRWTHLQGCWQKGTSWEMPGQGKSCLRCLRRRCLKIWRKLWRSPQGWIGTPCCRRK